MSTAVCPERALGAPTLLKAVHEFVFGEYIAPVPRGPPDPSEPPHTIIRAPVHTAVWPTRGSGAPLVLVAVQVSVAGS
jgi:hypothetical protein